MTSRDEREGPEDATESPLRRDADFQEGVRAASSLRVARFSSGPPSPSDRLFVGLSTLPVESGFEGVLRAALEVLTQAIPSYSVAASFADVPGGPVRVLKSGFQPEVDERDPGEGLRVFPEMAFERRVPIDTGPESVALHIAGEEGALEFPSAFPTALINRTALALGRALDHARLFAEFTDLRAENERLRGALAHLDKMATMGQLAAGVLHDLNNPLTAIVGNVDFLAKKHEKMGRPFDPDDGERLHRIDVAAHRLLKFTRDLVSYFRPGVPEAASMTLEATISEAASFCEHEFERASVRFEVRLGEGSGRLEIPLQFVQVFVNLFSNACHAMPSGGGILTVTSEMVVGRGAGHRPALRIVVEDTGTGIDPVTLAHVFSPYFTTKGEGRGTGLGLAIVKTIIENHGGEVRVESLATAGGAPVSPNVLASGAHVKLRRSDASFHGQETLISGPDGGSEAGEGGGPSGGGARFVLTLPVDLQAVRVANG